MRNRLINDPYLLSPMILVKPCALNPGPFHRGEQLIRAAARGGREVAEKAIGRVALWGAVFRFNIGGLNDYLITYTTVDDNMTLDYGNSGTFLLMGNAGFLSSAVFGGGFLIICIV